MAKGGQLRVLVVGYGSTDITFIDQLITGLTRKGVAVTVASPSKKYLNHIESEQPDWLWTPAMSANIVIRLARLLWLMVTHPQLRRPTWFSKLLTEAQGWRSKFEVFCRYRPFTNQTWDVIYFPWNSAAIDYIGLFDSGMRVVVSCRGSQVNIRPHLKGQEQFTAGLTRTFTRADAVHCVSQDILEEAEQYGLDRKKAVVIHPAVDTDLFSPVSKTNPGKILKLITVSSLTWVKGNEYLLMALGCLRDRGIQAELHIIGAGYERSRILFTAQDLNLEDQVILHGKLSPDQVRQQLQQADIFIYASLSEGLPNSVLEAMSCGLPVVTSDCGGVREAVTDGVEGHVVPVREPGLMADALQKLAEDVDLRGKMGTAGRERVLRDFRREDQVEAFVSLFHSVDKTEDAGGAND